MTSDYWNSESGFYDRQWKGSLVSEFDYACTKDVLFRFLEPSMNDNILEIGCGLGTWTGLVGCKCRAITALDISKEMIRKARKNVKIRGVRFVASDFLFFRTKERFNKILAVRSFEYLDDTKAGLRKVWGMLKPNGKFVIITKSKPCAWEFVYHERWKRDGFRQNKVSCIKMKKLLRSAGFMDIKTLPVILRFPIFHGGNMEIPLIPNSAAKYLLMPGLVLRGSRFLIPFAESYAICATRGGS